MRVAVLFACLCVGAALHAEASHAEASTQKAQETRARQKLDEVRAQIRDLTDAQRQTHDARDRALAALRGQDLAVAALAVRLRETDASIASEQRKLDGLLDERGKLEHALGEQRNALAALLRSAYAMGHGEELKLLLAQDNPGDMARVLAYYHYFQSARLAQIERLRSALQALEQVQDAIATQTRQLQAARTEQLAQAQALETGREARHAAVAHLNGVLREQKDRLAALAHDEKALLDLIERLRDIFADIPSNPTATAPFAAQRGSLPWPVQGRVIQAFGASRDGAPPAQGMYIAAPNGSAVLAVAHGRVVFADWLRGYGLLLIIDHGDGYLSLYGGNETLLRDVGDWVEAGQSVATSGESAARAGAGLYFELRHDARPVDPRPWLRKAP